MPDAVGNLFKTTQQKDREYGPAGQLLAVHSAKGTTSYAYDAEGNLIRKTEPGDRIWRYEWNGAGMMAKIIRPDGKEVTFEYDAFGRRIKKIFNHKITRWVWDGHNPLHEWVEYQTATATAQSLTQLQAQADDIAISQRRAQLQSLEPQGPPALFDQGTKEQPITWLFEPDSFAPMAKLIGDEHYSIVNDHLGTPSVIFDKAGEQVWSSDITVWGELRNLRGEKDFCPFRFPGQYEDSETGLYYNRFRYFDPQAGQYASQDPIKLHGRNPTIYGYVFDSNIEIDPFGLACRQKGIGDWGENWAKEQLEKSGKYKKVIAVQNGSNHGIDLVGIRKDGKFDFFEVKTNTTGKVSPISTRQENAAEFIQDILGPDKAQKGGWGVTPAEAIKMADPANMGDTRIIDIFIKNGKLDKVLTSVW